MKTLKSYSLSKNLLFVILTSILIFSFHSCAKKMSFLTSSIVPAAQGTVKVKTDSNKNYSIDIDIFNLAEPERLHPPRQMYILWMLTDQDMTKNIGQVKTSSATFSKNLKASFQTVSSFKPIKIFVTAEDDPNIQYPGWEVILSTERF